MRRQWILLVSILCAALSYGHHSTAPYDLIHGTVIGGKVTQFEWLNPHSHIFLDVIAEEGAVEHWIVEIESPVILQRLGWNKTSLKSGEKVIVMGSRAKNGSLALRGVTVELSDGRKLKALME